MQEAQEEKNGLHCEYKKSKNRKAACIANARNPRTEKRFTLRMQGAQE